MGRYEIDFPEIIYYLAPVILHISISLAMLRFGLQLRRTTFFTTTVSAILGVVGVSLVLTLNVNHVERFAESMIAVVLLASFNLLLTLLGAYKVK